MNKSDWCSHKDGARSKKSCFCLLEWCAQLVRAATWDKEQRWSNLGRHGAMVRKESENLPKAWRLEQGTERKDIAKISA